MNPIHETDLKSIFSWPASLWLILYYIRNKDTIWKWKERELHDRNKIYDWTYDFMVILWLVKDYENWSLILTQSWLDIYEIIKEYDKNDEKIFFYWITIDSKLDEYYTSIYQKLWEQKLNKLKNIFSNLIVNTKWYNLIKEVLEKDNNIWKWDLYKKLAEKLEVATATLSNRVPSMLQLCNIFSLININKWKYSIANKNYTNYIKEPEQEYNSKQNLHSNNSSMEKLTSQESLLLISLLTKPFSILYWVSWTWKSRVVKELWRKIYWDNYSSYFHKEAVPPNWFDDSEIIWRYNEIEKYQEGSFIKHLEKAIKDPDNNYVYLLDEMNLSHIEQYMAQYLSAIEDLNNWNTWINVGKIDSLTDQNTYNSNQKEKNEFYQFSLNDDPDIKLSKRDWSLEKWDIFIRWELTTETWEIILESNKTPTDFYRNLMRYFIDNYEWVEKVFKKIDDWKFWEYANADDYEEYNGYYYKMALNTLNKIKEIKKISSELDINLMDNIKFTFKKIENWDLNYEYNNLDYYVVTNLNYTSFDSYIVNNKRIWKIIINNKNFDVESIKDDIYIKALEYYIDEYLIKKNKEIKISDYLSDEEDNYKFNHNYNWYYFYIDSTINWKIKYFYDLVKHYSPDLLKWVVFYLDKEKTINNSEVPTETNNWILYFYGKHWDIIWKSLKLPNNFFVVWTINLDETTKSISPKVVDRASIIELNDLDNFLFITDNNKYDLSVFDNTPTNIDYNKIIQIRNDILALKWVVDLPKWVSINNNNQEILNKLYNFLKIFKLHFSYRTLKEIIIFVNIWTSLWLDENKLFDLAILQKILPKLNWIIDNNFKLYSKEKCLWYNFDSFEDNSILWEYKNILEDWLINQDLINTNLKLKRMQQFFDTYQNVNYFLS